MNTLLFMLFSLPVGAGMEFDSYVKQAESRLAEAAGGTREVTGGLIHDWSAERFIANRTPEEVIKVLQDYNRYREIYPEVTESRLISRQGNRFKVALQLKRHKILTVILNTEYDVDYEALENGGWRVLSRSTKVKESEGTDHGFLWRLNSYWTITSAQGGVKMHCRSISISRDVPHGLGWMVKPLVREMPRESLVAMLAATAKALQ